MKFYEIMWRLSLFLHFFLRFLLQFFQDHFFGHSADALALLFNPALKCVKIIVATLGAVCIACCRNWPVIDAPLALFLNIHFLFLSSTSSDLFRIDPVLFFRYHLKGDPQHVPQRIHHLVQCNHRCHQPSCCCPTGSGRNYPFERMPSTAWSALPWM